MAGITTTLGTLTIQSGTVTAKGMLGGAGIGGDLAGDGGVVIITGGTVTASGDFGGAGIGGLVLYAVAAAAVIAAVSLLFAPLGALALIALGWFGFAARRRADEKYAGLRILR